MKKITLLAALIIQFIALQSLSQNLVKDYEPPPVIKGSNLYLDASPSFGGYYLEDDIGKTSSYNFSGGIRYSIWQLTKKLNYSFNSRIGTSLSLLKHTNPEETNYSTANLHYGFDGGCTYYILKSLLYAGIFNGFYHRVENENLPIVHADVFPVIGTGRLVNTARTNYAENFQQVLLDEKIISMPLPRPVMKKIITLLDKRSTGEFRSLYKDDDEIEFFSQLENTLKEDNVISGNLGSKTVLKMYQALTNQNFYYIPNYSGYQVQGELKYTVNNEYSPSSNLSSLTLSGIYGLPITDNKNITGAVFLTFPLYGDYLLDYDFYEYHSPVSLAEKERLLFLDDILPNRNYFIEDKISWVQRAKIIYSQILGKTVGLSISLEEFFPKKENGEGIFYYEFKPVLYYRILNRLWSRVSISIGKSKDFKFFINTNGSISYYLF